MKDYYKEKIANFRFFLGILTITLIAVGSGIITSFRNNVYDLFFYAGLVFSYIGIWIFVIVLFALIQVSENDNLKKDN